MSSPVIGQEPLSIIHLWRKFRSLRPDFVSSFAAYQHFRSRGWVPKEGGGAKYGVDFSKTHTHTQKHVISHQSAIASPLCVFTVLYRKGPPFYHAR